jgi:uncharacterized lipoprotein YmbA
MKNQKRYKKTLCLLPLSALVGLAGCMSLGRGEPAQQHYVLGGSTVQAGGASPELTGLSVGIRRLDLATYLETPFILVRRGPNRLGYSEFHRWGEALAGGINRTVAGYLGDRSQLRGVDVAPWPAGERYDYVIQLHVLRFEGLVPEGELEVNGDVHMLAAWEIIRQLDGVVLARGTTDYRENGWRLGDYAGLVTQLDLGLQTLTEQLLASLRSLATTR